jgi:ABC-type antimicrobial peptide transport system permease subunit
VDGVVPLDEVINAELAFRAFWFRLTVAVSAVALLLSLTGVYAVMSFTVSRRTREIGIRVALGADRRRIVVSIFRRPLTQVALGIIVGGIFVASFSLDVTRGAFSRHGAALFFGYAFLMMGVCAMACIVPTRRALRVQPTDALRTDAA